MRKRTKIRSATYQTRDQRSIWVEAMRLVEQVALPCPSDASTMPMLPYTLHPPAMGVEPGARKNRNSPGGWRRLGRDTAAGQEEKHPTAATVASSSTEPLLLPCGTCSEDRPRGRA